MREIKFRAWDKHYKVMVGVGGVKDLFSIRSDGKPSSQHYILMQFTGLRDKNGKEIYEGDIVNFFNGIGEHYKGEIKFTDGCFEINSQNIRYGTLRDYLKVYVGNHAVEVIGNIYENPELLRSRDASLPG